MQRAACYFDLTKPNMAALDNTAAVRTYAVGTCVALNLQVHTSSSLNPSRNNTTVCRKLAFFGVRAEILPTRNEEVLESQTGPFFPSWHIYSEIRVDTGSLNERKQALAEAGKSLEEDISPAQNCAVLLEGKQRSPMRHFWGPSTYRSTVLCPSAQTSTFRIWEKAAQRLKRLLIARPS